MRLAVLVYSAASAASCAAAPATARSRAPAAATRRRPCRRRTLDGRRRGAGAAPAAVGRLACRCAATLPLGGRRQHPGGDGGGSRICSIRGLHSRRNNNVCKSRSMGHYAGMLTTARLQYETLMLGTKPGRAHEEGEENVKGDLPAARWRRERSW